MVVTMMDLTLVPTYPRHPYTILSQLVLVATLPRPSYSLPKSCSCRHHVWFNMINTVPQPEWLRSHAVTMLVQMITCTKHVVIPYLVTDIPLPLIM